MGNNRGTFPNTRAVVEALKPSYPVFCFRPHLVADAARRFLSLFPGTPLYAVKCNPHPYVLDALYEAGLRHFDTASLPEIAQICEHYERANAYFMHPVKTRASIETAFKVYGIRHYVVDHINELKKLRDLLPDDDIVAVVRIRTSEEAGAMLHLAGKFGAEPLEAVELLREARDYGWGVGLAFHVGSQCLEPSGAAGVFGGPEALQ
jgi:ornithine decarboxylase